MPTSQPVLHLMFETAKQKEGDPGSVPAARVPCATRNAGRLRNSGLRPSNSARRRPPAFLRCSAPLKGPGKASPPNRQNSLLAVFLFGRCQRAFSGAEPSFRDAFRVPMRGAEQRRLKRKKGEDCLRAKPEFRSPRLSRVAQGTRAAGADPGVAFFFGYFLLGEARRKYARPQGGTHPPNKPTQQFAEQQIKPENQKQESLRSPEAPPLKTKNPQNYILSIIASPNPEQESSSAPAIKRAKS
ncbi:MAG: hypothetical protein H6R15_3521 [Proteobacteria bacterium]|nr:hypothetical protein [Pseudomonadota bacterium]